MAVRVGFPVMIACASLSSLALPTAASYKEIGQWSRCLVSWFPNKFVDQSSLFEIVVFVLHLRRSHFPRDIVFIRPPASYCWYVVPPLLLISPSFDLKFVKQSFRKVLDGSAG